MATWYIAPTGNDTTGTGTSGNPYKTFQKVHAVMSAGDTAIAKNGTYLLASGQGLTGAFRITKANTTWQAESEHGAIFRGDWGASLLTETRPTIPCTNRDGAFNGQRVFMPSYRGRFASDKTLITAEAENVTIDGFVIESHAGPGIGGEGACSGLTIENCVTYWTKGQGINVYPGNDSTREADFPSNITIQNNRVIFASVMRLDPVAVCQAGRNSENPMPDPVTGAIRFGNITNSRLLNNTVEFSFGEGVDMGKRPYGTATAPIIVDGNTVHDCRHVHIYVLHGRHVHVRNNIVYATSGHTVFDDFPGEPIGGNGYVIRDEDKQKFNATEYVSYYNNLAVNTSKLCYFAGAGTTGLYIGFNTFAGGPNTQKTGVTISGAEGRGIIENNLFFTSAMPAGVTQVSNTTGGYTYRRNAFTLAQNKLRNKWLNDADNIYGAGTNLWLGAPGLPPVSSGFDYYETFAAFDAGYSNNFDPYYYHITDERSVLIDTATLRTAQGGFMPPIEPFQTDRTGAARSSPGDMGAHEYAAVAGTVTAGFTVSTDSGAAPLTVTFTDDSDVTGTAVVNDWLWEFGDGQTATGVGPQTHVYGQAGSYTARLTVRDTVLNLSSVATDTITVTETVDVSGAIDAVRVALRSGTGTQTVAFSLNGAAPDLVLFYLTNATAAATKTDNAMFVTGAAVPGSQWAVGIYSRDAQATTVTKRYTSDTAAVISLDHTGLTGAASVTQFAADSITLNVTDAFPAAYLLTAVAISQAARQSAAGLIDIATATAISAGFAPDFLSLVTAFNTSRNTTGNNAYLSLAHHADYNRRAVPWMTNTLSFISKHGEAAGDVEGAYTGESWSNLSNGAYGYITRTATGASVAKDEAGLSVGQVGYAAIGMGGENQAILPAIYVPATTGTVAYTLESTLPDGLTTETFEPGLLILTALPRDFDDAAGTDPTDTFTVAIVDAGATYSLTFADVHGAATSDTWSRVDNSIAIRDSGGTLRYAGTVSLTATGFSINWTTVNADTAVTYILGGIAIRKLDAAVGPVAGFSFVASDDGDGEVVFTDTSNANGAAITAWLWNFGDTETSTTASPTHVYDASGTYSVSLTVTNANGSDTVTRSVTVAVDGDDGDAWPIGPYEPMTVTNNSVTQLHTDPGDPQYMRIESALNLDALVFDATPTDATSVRAGKIRIVADVANNRLKVILPSGTVKYIAWS